MLQRPKPAVHGVSQEVYTRNLSTGHDIICIRSKGHSLPVHNERRNPLRKRVSKNAEKAGDSHAILERHLATLTTVYGRLNWDDSHKAEPAASQ
ncbi:hypothetical protein G7K_5005-t1 [Saitoella complicata NRRL Y-17804]|uniref:Uncharacterized protein n=1 Tax=Saitoella complicata (strain BCRC 22490 / CBS 7301 / JCM 7358 / NBRC 10748 / NRRL Y-17804) TaxID=698492 RepID=A0A0E9NMJ1_SAICN|nr:hypothetical protein G7K_5005-t1 [Saitoella complicata NRRL Y-17804]